jgi:hypothetical protein
MAGNAPNDALKGVKASAAGAHAVLPGAAATACGAQAGMCGTMGGDGMAPISNDDVLEA